MVDRSIARLLRYRLMPRLHLGATAVACIVGFWTTGCAGKKPAPVPSAPISAVPVDAAPAPAIAVRPPQLATVASAPRPAAPEVAGQSWSARPADRPAANQAQVQSDAQPQTHQPVSQTPTTDFPEPKQEPAPIDDLLTISPAETPEPTPATARTVAEDLSAHPRDIEIPQNARVLSYVELFSGRLQGYMEDGLNRGSQYLPMIQEVFRSEGVPLDLAYVPLVESAFKPNAVSRAKAKGIWQFMRGTALENGLKHDWYIDERADPEKATRAAARYLKTLYGMFGDWNLALASYNGGPGRVQKAIRRSGKHDFWAISKTRKYLPRETREYVPLMLAAVTVARNPTQYGMSLTPVADPSVDRVMLPVAVDLLDDACPRDGIRAEGARRASGRRACTSRRERRCGSLAAHPLCGQEERDVGHRCAQAWGDTHRPRGSELSARVDEDQLGPVVDRAEGADARERDERGEAAIARCE